MYWNACNYGKLQMNRRKLPIIMKDKASQEKATMSEDLKAMQDLVHSTVGFEEVKSMLEEPNPSDENIDFCYLHFPLPIA